MNKDDRPLLAPVIFITWVLLLLPCRFAVAQTDGRSVYDEPFRDCSDCPLMRMIPAGAIVVRPTFVLQSDGQKFPGTPGPKARRARIERPLAVSIFPVTRDQYARFMLTSGRSVPRGCYHWDVDHWIDDPDRDWSGPGFNQTADDPVVCVNFMDAEAYISWLNGQAQSGHPAHDSRLVYRLPTREEQEYAEAGGRTSQYYWGRHPARTYANFGGSSCLPCAPAAAGADRWVYTSPAGAFPPNPFGLFDTAGNVWEWSSYCEPDDPPYKECLWGEVHGGSWLDVAASMQRDSFSIFQRDNRNDTLGFRVVATREIVP